MSKDISDFVTADTEGTSYVQAQADAFTSFMAIPVTKLDADQYLVSDLDGVTEGLFGSGNMNFLMMQSGQTNESIQALNDFDRVGGSDGISSMLPTFFNGGIPIGQAGGHSGSAGGGLGANLNDADAFGRYGDANRTSPGAIESINSATGTHSSSFLNSAQNFVGIENNNTDITRILPPGDPVNGTSGIDGTSGADGVAGPAGTNGSNGADGNNGADGVDGNDGNPLDLNPVGLNLSLGLDNISNITADVISGGQVINVIDEMIDGSPVLQQTDDLLGNIASNLDMGLMLNPFQYDNSPDDKDLTLGTDLDSLGLPLLSSLDNLNIPLDPLEGLVGDLDIGLNNGNILPTDLLGGENDDTDVGLNIDGLTSGLTSALPLDLPFDVPLSGENVLLNPVEDLVGDVDLGITPDIALFDSSAIDNAAGDTDVTLPLDIGLLDNALFSDMPGIDLGVLEQITGDIDLDITAAAGLFGNTATNLIDPLAGGSSSPNLASGMGDNLSSLGTGILPPADGDSDIGLATGAGILDIPLLQNNGALSLDAIEDLTGDIDMGLNPSADLLGTPTGTDNNDLTMPFDLSLLGEQLAGQTQSFNLDALEALTGNIDIMAPIGSDLVADPNTMGDDTQEIVDVAPGLVEGASTNLAESVLSPIDSIVTEALNILDMSGGNLGDLNTDILGGGDDAATADDLGMWTESLLPDAGNILGGGLGAADITSILPDPFVSTPVVPITAPPVVHDLLQGAGLGGSRFGGLFG